MAVVRFARITAAVLQLFGLDNFEEESRVDAP
jgi:hypothetical protein